MKTEDDKTPGSWIFDLGPAGALLLFGLIMVLMGGGLALLTAFE